MNWFLDVFSLDESDNLATLAAIERLRREVDGPCEDDVEVVCPYVDMLPEETTHEEPSPLEFRSPEEQSEPSPNFVNSVRNAMLDNDWEQDKRGNRRIAA